MRVRARTESFSVERISEEELKLARAPDARNWCWPHSSGNLGTSIATEGRLTTDVPNVCLPSLCFHLRRRKFSIIWPGIRMRKTPSMASFIGGCSTPASKNGRRKLQGPSLNSSNKVFSNNSDVRMAMYFTASPRIISRRFGNGHHETLLLTQLRKSLTRKYNHARHVDLSRCLY